MAEYLMQARGQLSYWAKSKELGNHNNLGWALWDILIYLEEQEASRSGPPTTASPITAGPLAALALESTAATTLPSSLQPGDQMVADLFHAANCSTCAEALGVLLAQCRTHALGVAGTTSTSQRQDTPSSADLAAGPAGSASATCRVRRPASSASSEQGLQA